MTRTPSHLAATAVGAAMLLAVSVGHSAKGKGATAPAVLAVTPPPAFATCKACHSVTKGGPNGVGPNLFGTVGAQAGAKPGFAYSPAMKASRIRWTRSSLDAYLTDPKAVVPGTKMMIPGIKDATKRSEIISYLETLK